MPARLDGRRGRNSLGMHMTQTSLTQRRTELTGEMVQLQEHIEKLQADLDKQKKLVSTLITLFMEEADGVQSGAAPTIPNQPKRGYCM
jgi:hypothetical protein